MTKTNVPAGYEDSIHLCVRKRTGRTWYAVGSMVAHYTNADIFDNVLVEMVSHFPELEFAVKPYETRRPHPFRLNLDKEDPTFEIEHDGWV